MNLKVLEIPIKDTWHKQNCTNKKQYDTTKHQFVALRIFTTKQRKWKQKMLVQLVYKNATTTKISHNPTPQKYTLKILTILSP